MLFIRIEPEITSIMLMYILDLAIHSYFKDTMTVIEREYKKIC